MQQNDVRVDVQPMKEQIESFNLKKRKAIDLMIDGLITKENLKKQTEYYDDEILKLTEQIAKSQDISMLRLSSMRLWTQPLCRER